MVNNWDTSVLDQVESCLGNKWTIHITPKILDNMGHIEHFNIDSVVYPHVPEL